MKAKEVFKPTKEKIGLAIAFFIFNLLVLSSITGTSCPSPAFNFCTVKQDTPGARYIAPPPSANFPGIYVIPGERVPFTCTYACPGEEYNSALTNILVVVSLIGVLGYGISSMLIFSKTAKKKGAFV